MKVASSMAELEKMIMDEIYSAMSTAKSKAEQDTKTEVQSFYSQGSPTIYVRTGNLVNSVRANGASRGGRSVEFTIWLDQSISYNVPNLDFTSRGFPSYFTTPEIFQAAESGSSGVKGKSGFWARSFEKIKSDTDNALSMYFART